MPEFRTFGDLRDRGESPSDSEDDAHGKSRLSQRRRGQNAPQSSMGFSGRFGEGRTLGADEGPQSLFRGYALPTRQSSPSTWHTNAGDEESFAELYEDYEDEDQVFQLALEISRRDFEERHSGSSYPPRPQPRPQPRDYSSDSGLYDELRDQSLAARQAFIRTPHLGSAGPEESRQSYSDQQFMPISHRHRNSSQNVHGRLLRPQRERPAPRDPPPHHRTPFSSDDLPDEEFMDLRDLIHDEFDELDEFDEVWDSEPDEFEIDDLPYPYVAGGLPSPRASQRQRKRVDSRDYTPPAVSPEADAMCSICMEGHMPDNGLVQPHVCHHDFHVACLDEWLNSNNGNALNCPICRKEIT